MAHEQLPFSLPISVVSRVDVGRLLRETESLSEFLNATTIREAGTPVSLPKTSRLLDELVQTNQINPLLADDRQRLMTMLNEVKQKAPVVHMSFSADPSPLFASKLIAWLRREIHPLVLLQVGLQPNIGAGAIVRTTNQHFDFSLRKRFSAKRQVLAELIHGSVGVAADAPAPELATPPVATEQTRPNP